MFEKKEKQVLNLELYEKLINENNQTRFSLKEQQQDYLQSIEYINQELDELKRVRKIIKENLIIKKRALKNENRALFKTNKSLKILNRKNNKLNKLFSSNDEKSIVSSSFVLTKKKKKKN